MSPSVGSATRSPSKERLCHGFASFCSAVGGGLPRSLPSSLAGGAAFATSWFVGQVTGGAGGNVAAAAVWERATVDVTEGISLLQGLSPAGFGISSRGSEHGREPARA